MLEHVLYDNEEEFQTRARYWVARRLDEYGRPLSSIPFDKHGLSLSGVYRFVKGKQDITLRRLTALADLLGCDPRILLAEVPPEVCAVE